MSEHTLSANQRTVLGKKVKFLREKGLIPATIYAKGEPSMSIEVDEKAMTKALLTAGKSTIIHLTIGTTVYPVLIVAISRNPVRHELLNVEFHKVNLKEKIKAHVQVEYIGEAIGVKDAGGLLLELASEIEVEALPNDLPEKFIIDVTPLATIGAEFQVKDIPVPKGVTILADPEVILVKVTEKVKEEVVEPPAETAPAAEGEAAPVTTDATEPKAE